VVTLSGSGLAQQHSQQAPDLCSSPIALRGSVPATRGLTLDQLALVGVELALRFQHRQEIDETRPVLFGGKIDSQLALLDSLIQSVAAFLFLRVADQCVFDFLEGIEGDCFVVNQRLTLARGLHSDVGANASPGEEGQAYAGAT